MHNCFVVIVPFIIGILLLPNQQSNVPPPLEAKDCTAKAPRDELPNARFDRKGGQTTPAKVRHQGSALMIDDVEQGRDLSQYDRLELEDPSPFASEPQTDAIPRSRTFLWQHWHAQKRAYLILTLHSVDATGTSHVFVEPDNDGRWRVYWRIVRDMNEVSELPTYYAIEWAFRGEWNKPGKPLPKGRQPDPGKHVLNFRDRCGDVEYSF